MVESVLGCWRDGIAAWLTAALRVTRMHSCLPCASLGATCAIAHRLQQLLRKWRQWTRPSMSGSRRRLARGRACAAWRSLWSSLRVGFRGARNRQRVVAGALSRDIERCNLHCCIATASMPAQRCQQCAKVVAAVRTVYSQNNAHCSPPAAELVLCTAGSWPNRSACSHTTSAARRTCCAAPSSTPSGSCCPRCSVTGPLATS